MQYNTLPITRTILTEKSKFLEIALEGYMNAFITKDNYFVADTNDSANWHEMRVSLPSGKWNIYSYAKSKVILHKD